MAVALPSSAATVLPEFRVESRYDDNVLHVPQGSEDMVLVMAPSLLIYNRDPVTWYEVAGRMGFTSYRRTDAPNSRLDLAGVRFNHQPTQFDELDLRARYVQTVDPIDFFRGQVVARGNVSSAQTEDRLDFLRAGGWISYNRWDYADAASADGSAIDYSASLYPVNNGSNRLALEFRHQELEVGGAVSLLANFQTANYRRRHTQTTRTEIKVGRVQFEDIEQPGTQVNPAVSFEYRAAGGDRPWEALFRIADDIATTFHGGVDYGFGGRALSVAYETTLDAQGGVYKVPTLTNQSVLGAADTLSSGQIFEVAGSYAQTRPLHGAEPKVDVWRASAVVWSPLGPYLTGRLGWDYMNQTAPSGGTATEFDRNRYSLAVVAGLRSNPSIRETLPRTNRPGEGVVR